MRSALGVVIAIGIVSVVATIVVGMRTFDGTVVSDPYETGLRWDLERKEREGSGWTVTLVPAQVRTGRATVLVELRDRDGHLVPGADIAVRLGMPHTDRFDREYRFTDASAAGYRSAVDVPVPGRWEAVVSVTCQGRTARFMRHLDVMAAR